MTRIMIIYGWNRWRDNRM